MTPTFLERLADPSVRTVLMCGCGGGFDFVHALLLYPELVRREKRIVLGSFSFGDVDLLGGDAVLVFEDVPARAKRVTAKTAHGNAPALEVHVCSFLDGRYERDAPHVVYAYYSRAFTVPALTRFYAQLVDEHQVDAVVLFDGGTDSLVVGDEAGLGDPIEDAVSVQSVAALSQVPLRLLVNVGVGVDRYNGVSDGASLRAVAELTAAGGFLGAMAVEGESEGYACYRDALDHVYARQGARSIVAGSIVGAIEGAHGCDAAPASLEGRPLPGSLFVWPLMGMLWAFDVEAVAARSRLGSWIREAATPAACYEAVRAGRRSVPIREPEEDRLPEPAPWPYAGLFDVEDGDADAAP